MEEGSGGGGRLWEDDLAALHGALWGVLDREPIAARSLSSDHHDSEVGLQCPELSGTNSSSISNVELMTQFSRVRFFANLGSDNVPAAWRWAKARGPFALAGTSVRKLNGLLPDGWPSPSGTPTPWRRRSWLHRRGRRGPPPGPPCGPVYRKDPGMPPREDRSWTRRSS